MVVLKVVVTSTVALSCVTTVLGTHRKVYGNAREIGFTCFALPKAGQRSIIARTKSDLFKVFDQVFSFSNPSQRRTALEDVFDVYIAVVIDVIRMRTASKL